MTYDLDQKVAAAINAAVPEERAYVTVGGFIQFGGGGVVYQDGECNVRGTANRTIARIVLDELDRQDATGGT